MAVPSGSHGSSAPPRILTTDAGEPFDVTTCNVIAMVAVEDGLWAASVADAALQDGVYVSARWCFDEIDLSETAAGTCR